MPVVALVKVLAMRLKNEERRCLAYFGTIAVRETHKKMHQRRNIQNLWRELYAMDAPAHIFMPINSIGNFFHAVSGEDTWGDVHVAHV